MFSLTKRFALLVVALSFIVAVAGVGRASAATQRHSKRANLPSVGERAVKYARRFLGVPYVWGGSSPRGFDCSGFVRYVYGHFGVSLPHSSYADFTLGRRVPRRALEPGDLVFFHGLGHVGLYVGHGKFIHAPRRGTTVSYATLAAYGSAYVGARRVVRA